MRRPDVFTLDYSHPLAQGLVFAGMCGEHDSTLYRNDIAAEGGPAFRYDPTIGRCVWDFDGTDDRLVIPSAPHLQFGAGGAYPFTVCAWVYMRSSKAFRIFSKFDGAAENYEWSLHTINTSTLHFRCYTDVDNYIGRSTGTVLSLVGSWAHIVGLYRGGLSISNIEIYINGIRSDNINSSSSGYTGIGSTDQPLYIGYRDSTVSWSNGLQADTLAFNRALSPAEIALLADRTDPMLGGLIVENRPVLWFDMGGSTVHDLSGQNVAIGSPTVIAPAIAQIHALAGQAVALASPTVSTPHLSIVDDLTGQNVVLGSPTVSSPSIGQIHVLGGDGVALGSPTVSMPTLAQAHALSAQLVMVAAPTVSMPALSVSANTDPLTAQGVEIGSPEVSSPAIAQIHALAGDGIGISAPTVSRPVLGQIHVLVAQDVAMGAPTVSMPGEIAPIDADEVGRSIALQGRNYSAVLAKRNYTARLS